MDFKEQKNQLVSVVAYIEKKTGYKITLKHRSEGKLLTGTIKCSRVKVAYVFFADTTQALHELGHLLAYSTGTSRVKPVSKLGMLFRELEAWTIAEKLSYSFNLPFDTQSFDMGFSAYLFDLINSQECPSFEWLSQLIGE